MGLSIPLVFHLNQHLSEYSRTASRACYRGLLRVLRSHPTTPVNIQISGTLIDALKWLDPEPLQLIWEGLRAGQFELLGSTYAQNVPYSSDDWDNQRQVEMHQEVLHETFGVTPVTFWNPERCWRQSLLPIVASAGYRFTLIEDYTLAQARLAEPVVVTSQVGPHILTLLYDDQQLKHLFDFAVWFGRPSQLQSYLMARADHPNGIRHCLTYAEDAEAMGLWGWREGIVPNQTWHRLDQVLSLLEAMSEIQLIHLTNAPPSAGNLTPIPDGCASWMDLALADENRPYHEPGYHDWFDFNENSPKLIRYRQFFKGIRDDLKATEAQIEEAGASKKKNKAARAIYETALHNYLGHQYEFGCIGVGGEGYRGWDGAQASQAILRVAQWALNPQPLACREDVNHDGHEELVLSDGRQVIITTPFGGRLLYWFNISDGQQFIGNQRAVTRAPYQSDSALPHLKALPHEWWLPEEYRPQAIVPGAHLTPESTPTRLGKFLPDWVWEGEREPFELLTREMRLEEGSTTLLTAQQRGLVDYITVNGVDFEPGSWLEQSEVSDGVLTFRRHFNDGLVLLKRYLLVSEVANGEPESEAVVVEYVWHNEGQEELQVSWQIVNELCPGYEKLIEQGRKVLDFVRDEERPGVANTAAKIGVFVTSDPKPEAISYEEAMLALTTGHTYRLVLGPGAEQKVTLRLEVEEVHRSKKRRR